MDTPPPSSPVNPNLPPTPPPIAPMPEVRSSGCGCFGAGCATFFVIALVLLMGILGACWYGYSRAINTFTSPEGREVEIQMPSEAEYTAAREKFEQMRTSLRARKAQTFTFTGPEMNALIARHPDFSSLRGRMKIEIANSIATVDMSAPLDSTKLPRTKHRWFNGSANFGFIYADEGFRFDANWIEANGHQLPASVLHSGQNSFNESFTRGFREQRARENRGDDAFENIRTMTLDEDKLVILTRGQ